MTQARPKVCCRGWDGPDTRSHSILTAALEHYREILKRFEAAVGNKELTLSLRYGQRAPLTPELDSRLMKMLVALEALLAEFNWTWERLEAEWPTKEGMVIDDRPRDEKPTGKGWDWCRTERK